MTTRAELHRLIDELPAGELQAAERFLRFLRTEGAGALPPLLRDAPADDEPEDGAERQAVEEGYADIAAGRVHTHDEVKRRLLGGT